MDKENPKLESLVAALDKDNPLPAELPEDPGLTKLADGLEEEDDEGADVSVQGDEVPATDVEPSEEGSRFAEARKALEDDDVDTALRLAFNKSAEELGVDKADWVNLRRARKAFKQDKAKLLEKVEKTEPVLNAVAAFRAGDYAKFAEIVEWQTGEPYEVASVKILRALKNSDPGKAILQKRLAELEAKPDPVVQAAEQGLAKAHPVRKLDGWQDKVKTLLVETSDDDGEPTMSAKEAADHIVAEEKKAAKARLAALEGEDEVKPRPRARAAGGAKQRKMSIDDIIAGLGKE